MKCVKYQIKARKNGETIIDTFGWFDESTDVKAYLEQQYSKRLFVVVIK